MTTAGGNPVTASPEWSGRTSQELRAMGETLMRIARKLHEHTHNLEVAVEGRYINEASDPRVRLLTESLHLSRLTDLELTRLHLSLQRVLLALQGDVQNVQRSASAQGISESEREALTTRITKLNQQRSEQETLYRIAQELNSTLKFDEVLRRVMDLVIDFVNAERGFLVLVNPKTNVPEFTIARDKDARTIPESAINYSRSTVRRVIQMREVKMTDDAQNDEALKANESIMAFNIRSVMCAPLIVRNMCIGAVYVDSRIDTNLFVNKHRDLLMAFCNQAAIAIDNARLFTQVNEDKQYMDNIFRSIANGVITTDAAGIITKFNQAAGTIVGLDASAVIGKPFESVFSALPQLKLVELFRDANSQNQNEQATLVPHAVDCELPGRGLVNLTMYMSSLCDPQGENIGMALVIDDRTDLKRSEAQARYIRRIFERYVHPKVVEELIKNPQALNLGGETKEISVIFADIRGYTRLSEMMEPEQVMSMINGYLKTMCEAIWEEEGTLTAFLGDALMAIFNAPLPQRTHALQAVRAAWKMRLAVQEYQRSLSPELRVSFGFGVNTGLATVGNVGSQDRMQNYTAIGDVVNVAARLQSNVSDNNILLNDSTYIQVYHRIRTGQEELLPVKNKSAPLKVRSLIGLL